MTDWFRLHADINECTLGTNNCNQVCHNTIGSYYCSCYAGFHLLNHPHICTGIIHRIIIDHKNTFFKCFKDVDECSDGSLHMCTQHCNNTLGSHFCDCYVGYELQDDGLTCTGEQMMCTNNYCTDTFLFIIQISMNVHWVYQDVIITVLIISAVSSVHV